VEVGVGVAAGVALAVGAGVADGRGVALGGSTGGAVALGVAVGTGVEVAVGVGVGVGSVSVTVAVVCDPSEPLSGLLRLTEKVLLGPTTGLLRRGMVISFDAVSPSFHESTPLVAV